VYEEEARKVCGAMQYEEKSSSMFNEHFVRYILGFSEVTEQFSG
jgi:hypothetical protein